MSDVFVSYAHVDSDFVELLRIKLEEAGINVWVDHSNLKAGTDWRISVDEGIKNSIVLALVMSPESLESQYVTYEWSFALGLGKPIVPLLYRETKLHAKLSTIQYLDFTHRILRPWNELIERIRYLMV